MEEINRKIISVLARDGRISFTELARETGLSVSAAQQRVRRLEQRGVIRGYAALIDPDQAGLLILFPAPPRGCHPSGRVCRVKTRKATAKRLGLDTADPVEIMVQRAGQQPQPGRLRLHHTRPLPRPDAPAASDVRP